MAYEDRPTATVPTRFGAVQLRVFSRTMVYVQGDVVVFSVPISFSLHLEDSGSGFSADSVRNLPELYATRQAGGDVSRAARDKLVEVVEAAVRGWAASNSASLLIGEFVEARETVERAEGVVAEARAKLAAAESELAQKRGVMALAQAALDASAPAPKVGPLRSLTKANARLMAELTRELADPFVGGGASSRRVDNAPDAFLPVCIERIGAARYSVAHYVQQNGDAMADPEVEFLLLDGAWVPVAIKQDPVGRVDRPVECNARDVPTAVNRRDQADLAYFANMFLRNIAEQQGITPSKPSGQVPATSDAG